MVCVRLVLGQHLGGGLCRLRVDRDMARFLLNSGATRETLPSHLGGCGTNHFLCLLQMLEVTILAHFELLRIDRNIRRRTTSPISRVFRPRSRAGGAERILEFFMPAKMVIKLVCLRIVTAIEDRFLFDIKAGGAIALTQTNSLLLLALELRSWSCQ